MNTPTLHARAPTRSRWPRFVRTRANRISLAIEAVVTAPIVAPIALHALATSTRRARRNLSSLGLHRRAASKCP